MNYLILGGAGFIGSHMVRRILQEETNCEVVVYDNFSSGRRRHLQQVWDEKRLTVIEGDLKDLDKLIGVCREGVDVVYSLASNPDISKAVTEPDIDFWEGTYLINNVVEAMRRSGVKNLLYASGSGVYGDVGAMVTDEDFSPLLPVSTYGASKLACEALICSYCHMFNMNAAAFRFANVVGPNQTHGVGYDFVRRLQGEKSKLDILGDGTQSKSYIWVEDVLSALRLVEKNYLSGYSYFNVATNDFITVAEIAEMVTEVLDLKKVKFCYTGGDRGWKGDVPVVRLSSEKLRKLGWSNRYSSREAMKRSVVSMNQELRQIEETGGVIDG